MKLKNTLLSFVVDASPKFYFQAELLITSILRNTSFTNDDIIVHCVTTVSQKFIAYLTKKNIKYNLINPFLDGKYCNKLAQLTHLLNLDKNVILLDTDIYFLNTPEILNENSFCAKIVLKSNPPLRVLKKIYKETGLALPKLVPTDWEGKGKTLDCNFNGGFYYIPSKMVKEINDKWRKWATYLFENKHFFENKAQTIFIDQIAMSLAITESGVAYASLASNTNCSIIRKEKLHYLNSEKKIEVIHYHAWLHNLGLLRKYPGNESVIHEAVDKINEQIVESNYVFDLDYRLSFTNPIEQNEKTDVIRSILKGVASTKRILLYVGTLNSGTRHLQACFNQHTNKLSSQNFSLAEKLHSEAYTLKDKWLFETMYAEDAVAFAHNVLRVIEETETDTIFLSSAAIYNHWFDFTGVAKSYLSVLNELFDTRIIVSFMEQEAYMYSFFKQNLKYKIMPKWAHGISSSFNKLINHDWFLRHLDYYSFLKEMELIVKANKIHIIPYYMEKIASKQYLNFHLDEPSKEHKNLLTSNMAILAYCHINRIKIHKINQLLKSIAYQGSKIFVTLFGDIPQEEISKEWAQLIDKEAKLLKSTYGVHLKK